MKNAIIFVLALVIALLTLSRGEQTQAEIEDTTKGQTFGLRSASEGQRGRVAMPNSARSRLLAGAKHEQRVAGPPVPLATGIAHRTNAVADHPASTNPAAFQADWQTCIVIPNGPIRRPDNYSAKPHGRKADSA